MKFNYEESQMNIRQRLERKNVNNNEALNQLTIGLYLRDLFVGSQGTIKELKRTYDKNELVDLLYDTPAKKLTGNTALISTKLYDENGREIRLLSETMISFIVPITTLDITGFEIEYQRKKFTGCCGDSTIAKQIIGKFEKNPEFLLEIIDSHCENLLKSSSVEGINQQGLITYFSKLLDDIILLIPGSSNNISSENVELMLKELNSHNSFGIIISRMLLSLIFLIHGETCSSNLTLEILNQIWCTSYTLHKKSNIGFNNVNNEAICVLSLHEQGRYEDAIYIIEQIHSKPHFNDIQDEKIRFGIQSVYAKQLIMGLGIPRAEISRGEQYLLNYDDNPQAKYLLYRLYNGDFSDKYLNKSKATFCLNEAASKGCVAALLEKLEQNVDCLEKSDDIISKIKFKYNELSSKEKQDFHYLSGTYYENVLHNRSKAEEEYKCAADLGHELAKKRLEKKERRLPKALPTFSQISNSTVCLINHWGNIARTFIASLPETIKVISLEETTDFSLESHNINYCDNIELFVNNISENHTSFDQVIIALMGDDQNKNLEDGIELLDRLFNLSITNNTIEKALLEKVELYILAPYEEASLFVDSNLNNMPDNMCFKVYICDPNRDAVLELLYNTPLFVPFLRKSVLHQKGAEQSNVVVFGDSELSINVIRQAVAVSYIGEMYPINITSISRLGESVETRFYSGLDGLYSNSLLDVNSEQKLRCITPRFLSCEINRPDFFLKFVPNNNPEDPVNEALIAANYYIVDIGTDVENIQFAINLRRWILKSTLSFDKIPVIAVHCSDIGAASALNTIPLSNQKQGEMWFNSYNLHCFGTYSSLYSYQNLMENNVIEMQSQYIHRSYYGDIKEEESYRKAMHDYFSCQYNHDSSIINAISLRYRLFLANCYDNWDFRYYFSSDEDANLAKKYEEWIKNNIGTAAQIEQSRWNSFMLTRGWSPATPQQVQGYIEQATGKQHKHMLAKLHPYICEWADLDSVTADLNKIFKKHKIETKNPSESTKKNVLDTTNILTKFKEKVVLVDHEKDI